MCTDQYKPMHYGPVCLSVCQLVFNWKKTLRTSRKAFFKKSGTYKVDGYVQVMHRGHNTYVAVGFVAPLEMTFRPVCDVCSNNGVIPHIRLSEIWTWTEKWEALQHLLCHNCRKFPHICTVTWFLFSLLPIAVYLMTEQVGTSAAGKSAFKWYILMLGQKQQF